MTAIIFADDTTLDRLEGEGRVAFRYAESVNGSARDIAGMLNEAGNVLGMMPHPERAATSGRSYPLHAHEIRSEKRAVHPYLALGKMAGNPVHLQPQLRAVVAPQGIAVVLENQQAGLMTFGAALCDIVLHWMLPKPEKATSPIRRLT
jgi:hypothetical protein